MNKFIIATLTSFAFINLSKAQDLSSSIALSGDSIVSIEFIVPEMEDTLLIIDEFLDDFFSEKIDSMIDSWFIENVFTDEIYEFNQAETFPQDLPDSIYISRLQNAQQVISLSYNDVVKNLIRMYTERRRDQVETMLGLSLYYFPLFEEVLDRYNLPLEIGRAHV